MNMYWCTEWVSSSVCTYYNCANKVALLVIFDTSVSKKTRPRVKRQRRSFKWQGYWTRGKKWPSYHRQKRKQNVKRVKKKLKIKYSYFSLSRLLLLFFLLTRKEKVIMSFNYHFLQHSLTWAVYLNYKYFAVQKLKRKLRMKNLRPTTAKGEQRLRLSDVSKHLIKLRKLF